MTLGLIASILVSTVIGFCIVHMLFPFKTHTPASLSLRLFLGAGLGVGLLSSLFFVLLLTAAGQYFALVEAVLMLSLAILCFFRIKRGSGNAGSPLPDTRAGHKFQRAVPIAFFGVTLSSAISFFLAFLRLPHGEWDAWIIWNLHARFIFRGGEHWKSYLTSGMDWTHPDYPLLLPLSVARCWQYTGIETQYAPMILSALFTFSVIGLMVCSLSILRSRYQGYLGGMLLMGSPFFITHGASQLADIPLAFFFVATVIVLVFCDRLSEHAHNLLLLAGVLAGLSAWTKNEGLLFLVVLMGVRFTVVSYFKGWRKSTKQLLWFLGGVLPILCIILYFKIQLAPQGDLFSHESMKLVIQRMSDFQRYYRIFAHFFQAIFSFTGGAPYLGSGYHFSLGVAGTVLLLCYLVLMGMKPEKEDKMNIVTIASTLVILLAGYFSVYVLTPQDLEWHLLTSLSRLLIQLWPMAILLCLLVGNIPEKALAESSFPSVVSVPSKPSKKKGMKTKP